MKLPDTNVLVYSVNASSPQHAAATVWLEQAFASQTVAFAWNALIGFVRIATHPRVMPAPLSVAEATGVVDEWLACWRSRAPAMPICFSSSCCNAARAAT